ncbi:hypothetical protein KR50_01750 [Jeotgalibacillus campisalis]|uniref:Uncharacterized protein n=1 Tax=Jeotgalibacillus campisalis TaxID=220754 RepID=A0A0C2W8C9_9BACL|nr:hypothetical protein KR50_01750 [Jeotgalibacillus campisalis]
MTSSPCLLQLDKIKAEGARSAPTSIRRVGQAGMPFACWDSVTYDLEELAPAAG